MSLYTQLQQARSEEDVKDAYIKALGLKGFNKGLIDIQTNEIWFEAKDTGKHSSYAMFTQLLHYVQDALNKGETVPPFLAVIDTEKAALMKSADVLPFLAKKTVKWGKSASQYTQEALDEISAHIGTHFVSFKIATHEEEFIGTVKAAIKSGDIIRTQITPDNLKQVFDKWVEMIGREIVGVSEEDYALLFFADIMHDGTVSTHANLPAELLHKNGAPMFVLNNTSVGRMSAALSDISDAPSSRRITAKNASSDLRDSPLPAEAIAVLDAGRTLWQAYFAHTDVRTVRDELKLNRSDVGWYQIRNALKARNASGDIAPVDFGGFEAAYKTLSEKLRPQVYELGFLR